MDQLTGNIHIKCNSIYYTNNIWNWWDSVVMDNMIMNKFCKLHHHILNNQYHIKDISKDYFNSIWYKIPSNIRYYLISIPVNNWYNYCLYHKSYNQEYCMFHLENNIFYISNKNKVKYLQSNNYSINFMRSLIMLLMIDWLILIYYLMEHTMMGMMSFNKNQLYNNLDTDNLWSWYILIYHIYKFNF